MVDHIIYTLIQQYMKLQSKVISQVTAVASQISHGDAWQILAAAVFDEPSHPDWRIDLEPDLASAVGHQQHGAKPKEAHKVLNNLN